MSMNLMYICLIYIGIIFIVGVLVIAGFVMAVGEKEMDEDRLLWVKLVKFTSRISIIIFGLLIMNMIVSAVSQYFAANFRADVIIRSAKELREVFDEDVTDMKHFLEYAIFKEAKAPKIKKETPKERG